MPEEYLVIVTDDIDDAPDDASRKGWGDEVSRRLSSLKEVRLPISQIKHNMNRRRVLKWIPFVVLGGGIVTLLEQCSQPTTSSTSLALRRFETVTVNAEGEIAKRDERSIQVFIEDLGNGVALELSKIPAGSFQMGLPETEAERERSATPQHQVSVASVVTPIFRTGS
jgi:hypothetical protein